MELLRRSTVHIRSGKQSAQSSGSGIVLTSGQILTNAHVVASESVRVEEWDGSDRPAWVLRKDPRRDLALLSAPGLSAPAATLGTAACLRAGTPVFAVGNPLGFSGAVSAGVVFQAEAGTTANGRWIYAGLRLAPGNSGGPLATYDGLVVGVNTMVAHGGIALAIPSTVVQRFLSASATNWLGATLRPVQTAPQGPGYMVVALEASGAAESASLMIGDILIGAGGRRFRSLEDIYTAIEDAPSGVLEVDFYRGVDRKPRRVAVRLLSRPMSSAA